MARQTKGLIYTLRRAKLEIMQKTKIKSSMGGSSKSTLAAAVSLNDISATDAFTIGDGVGQMLKDGMQKDRALDVTAALAKIVRRGMAAQDAVNKVLADYARRKS